jgi:hypothetical protein
VLGEPICDPVLRISEVGTTVANQYKGTTIIFAWKTFEIERKIQGPKLPKSFSTITRWAYYLFFSRECSRLSYIKMHTNLGSQ